MQLQQRIFITVFFAVTITIILFYVENRSNVPSTVAIPILVSLITKYVIGDWDSGFQFTLLDISYWISILAVSYATLQMLSKIEL